MQVCYYVEKETIKLLTPLGNRRQVFDTLFIKYKIKEIIKSQTWD